MTSTRSTPPVVRVLSILVALLSGAVAALVAYILAVRLSLSQEATLAWSGAAFIAVTYLAFTIEEKAGL